VEAAEEVVVVAAAEEGAEVEEEEVVAEAVEESPQDHLHSQESWEATHQKNSMETGRKASPSCSTSSCTEE